MNITELLLHRARQQPHTPALLDPRDPRPITFAELEAASAEFANVLWEKGLRPGDRVLVLVPMSRQFYIALLALFRLALVAVFPDSSAGVEQLQRCCRQCAPRGLIAGWKGRLLRWVSPDVHRIPVRISARLAQPRRGRGFALRTEPVPCSDEAPALITFTSGSTGPPKLVLRTHGFLLQQHRAVQKCFELEPGDVILAGLPLFVLSHLAAGATSVIPDADLRRPGAIGPQRVARQIERCGIRAIEASPALVARLAEYAVRHGKPWTGVARIYVGGAPVFPRDVARFRDAFPGACVVTVYGSTEAEPIARLTHSEVTSDDLRAMRQGRGLLAGRPVDTMQVRILPDQWGRAISPLRSSQLEAQCLPAGAAGEIVVHGPQVLTSYLHGEENAETKFFVGDATWHRTGDAGMFDVRGRLWLLGRCAARISDACGVLYPLAVEAAVSFHPGVRRAAVVSRDARRVLVVEPAQDACRDNLARLREELAWAHIDVLALESHIPLDQRHHAKIDYPALWRLLEAPQSHL